MWGQIHAHSPLPRINIDLRMLNIIIILYKRHKSTGESEFLNWCDMFGCETREKYQQLVF